MYNLLNIYSTLSYTALIILKGNFIFNLSTRTHIVSFYLPTTYMSIAPLRSMLCLKGIRTERMYANLHKCRQVINGLVLRPKGSRLTLARAPHSRREPQNEPPEPPKRRDPLSTRHSMESWPTSGWLSRRSGKRAWQA